MAKQLASKVSMFCENTSGHGISYEDWRLTFANAVGNEYFVDDFVMGGWLRGLLHQEIANDIDMVMGNDATGTSIYRFCSAKVLDTHLLGSIYASQLTDHHFNSEMQRPQSPGENPQQYVRDMVKKAYKIAATNQASQKYLCSQIYEGFTPTWKKALFYTFQGPIETVYSDLATLSRDVCYFFKLHNQSGGIHASATHTQAPVITQQNQIQYHPRNPLPPPRARSVQPLRLGGSATNTPSRQTENPPFDTNAFSLPVNSKMTLHQFDNLPDSVCKGGNSWKMGRGRNFVCGLCLTVGHTFEYCVEMNGFVEGGPAIVGDPRRTGSRALAITNSVTPQ
jgi:hypothetical protein